MSQQTRSLFVFMGLAAVAFSLLISPGMARILEVARNLHLNRSQSASSGSGGSSREAARILQIEREIAIKNDLVANLLAGRRTLDEVTDDFMLLVQNREIEISAIRCRYEGGSDREKVARTVLKFASNQPGVSEEALAHLEAEFHTLFPKASTPITSNEPATIYEQIEVKQGRPVERFCRQRIVPIISYQ